MQFLRQFLREGERICSSADYLESGVDRVATTAQLPRPRWQSWWIPRVPMLFGGYREKTRRRVHQFRNVLRGHFKNELPLRRGQRDGASRLFGREP